MSNWTRRPFGDLYGAPSKNGMMAPSRVRGTGALLVNMREIYAYDIINGQEMERAPLPDRSPEAWLLAPGDLLFARQSLTLAGAGKVSLVRGVPEPTTFESHIIRVRLDADIADSRFYYYLFRSSVGRRLMETIVEQVAAAGIRASDLARLAVPVPPLAEQRRIALVLGALDDLIGHNRRFAGYLEALVTAQFERLGFDAEPKSESVPLSALVTVNPKLAKPSGAAAYVDMAALPTDSSRISRVARRPASGGARFQNGDALLARLTPCLENGKAAYVDVLDEGEVGIGSTEFIVLRDKGTVGPHWAYVLTRSPRFREYAIRHMNGSSGRQRCSADSVERYGVRRPSLDALAVFRPFASQVFASIARLNEEVDDLTRTRDELLPLLMSGRLQVKDIEGEGPDDRDDRGRARATRH